MASNRIGLERGAAAGADGRDRHFLILEDAALFDRLQRRQAGEPARVGRILDEIAAVGEHCRLVDALKAAGCIDRAREERGVLRQVRQVDVRELTLGIVAAPLERPADHVEVLVGPIAHHPVTLEQALHQSLDDLRLLLREAAVHDQHVGDDQQVAVGDEHVRLAAAAVDDFRDFRLPRDAPGEPVFP